jgi:CO/xanthine dehydrogenase FAD-binding subunit
MPTVFKPTELDQALGFVAGARSPVTVLAGGTDLYPAHVGQKISGPVIDISRINTLNAITVLGPETQPVLSIGAAVKWSAITRREHAALHTPRFDCLVMAAREVGGLQIQNLGTVVGNLCNASPAADGVPALQALDARIKLASQHGVREIALVDFIVGPRKTECQPDEIVEAIHIPLAADQPSGTSHSVFLKLGHRRYLVISAVMTAVRLDWHDDKVAQAAVSVGACGPVALRLGAVEAQLIGSDAAQLTQFAATALAPDLLSALTPIDDLRGSAQYRVAAADQLIRRSIRAMAHAPGQGASSLVEVHP